MSNEAVVAHVNDLKDGEMQQVTVGETDVLLARIDGKFHAIGAYCTHYKAPLAEGVISGDRVICPWHNACFSLVTGDLQEPPGLNYQPCYAVRVDGDDVIVTVPESASQQRIPPMVDYNPVDQRTFVVLGAGAAGSAAVEALRQAGFPGRIVMVTQENELPYDRTWLSKDYFNGQVSRDEMPLRSHQFYQDCNIEVLLNKHVVSVDAATKAIAFADGETLAYDTLLIATGGKPRQLDIEGATSLENIFTLRSFADTEKILAAAKNAQRAVVIGSSFIGMEAAAGLAQKDIQVTVVSPSAVPFEKILGEEIGQLFQQVHEEQGVSFVSGTKAVEFVGNGKVETVVLENGDRIAADLVVVGVGVQPATEFVHGVELHADKSIVVDAYLCAADGLYAAGDLARYPDPRTGESTRVEHWRLAAQHGRVAAYNMAGKAVKFAGVPVFWTMQFKFPLRYVGHAEDWDEILFDGKLDEREFIAFYVKDNQVLAAAGSQRDTEMAAISELMHLQQMPTPDELRANTIDWVIRLQQQTQN